MRRIWIGILLVMAMGSQAQHRTQVLHPNIRTLRMRYMIEALEPSGTVSRPYLVLPESGVIDGSDEENAPYMDMGAGWNHSFYRDEEGNVHILHPKGHDYPTNWLMVMRGD